MINPALIPPSWEELILAERVVRADSTDEVPRTEFFVKVGADFYSRDTQRDWTHFRAVLAG